MSTIPIIAEVLDKEPSITAIWLLYGSIAFVGFLLCRYWRWWLATILPIVALIPALLLFEEFSSVGLLTSSESASYPVQFYIVVAAAVVFPIVGAIINFRKTRAI
ncbi:MAG TPA: hypothetical protein VI837_09495 [Blastocatellia bacterium]|nr:hypothetical protein [Blastocatellia bacterium]